MEKNGLPDTIQITYKQEPEPQKQQPGPAKAHEDFGTSTFVGRVGDNVTHHPRGVHDSNLWQRTFPRCYFEIFKACRKMFRLFLGI